METQTVKLGIALGFYNTGISSSSNGFTASSLRLCIDAWLSALRSSGMGADAGDCLHKCNSWSVLLHRGMGYSIGKVDKHHRYEYEDYRSPSSSTRNDKHGSFSVDSKPKMGLNKKVSNEYFPIKLARSQISKWDSRFLRIVNAKMGSMGRQI